MKNTVTQEYIDALYRESDKSERVVFDKCLVLSVQLPNGFILTESSACVDTKNFDRELGYNICEQRIKDKIWELEGYLLQDKISNINLMPGK